ncbi:MAG: HAMP domain-containing sensor histidine kinase [Planctomycetota bacterium]|nr:HAMP domain-containing sensor histidine kinase [Planctomycetota bacterium]
MPPLPTSFRLSLRDPRHVVAVLRLLVFAGLTVLGFAETPAAPWLYWSVTIVYGLTVAGYLAAHQGDLQLPRVRTFIFLFDAAVVTALLFMRGRDVQPLIMSYFTVVFLAAVLAGMGSALWNALLGTLLYAVVMGWGRRPADLIDLSLLGPAFFFFVIAVFMGHMATDALQRRKDRLVAGDMAAGLRLSTDRLRALRDGLRSEDRLRTVELLCAGIAHELRRPLAALRESARDGLGAVEALPAGEASDDLRAVLADFSHEMARLDQVASTLGEFGRGGSAQQALVGAGEVVAGAERLAAHSIVAPAMFSVTVSTKRAVCGDPARLVHALAILLGNAHDAVRAAGGGAIRLRAVDAGPDRVRFEVRDEGAGISADVRERMFDPFYTTKGAGQGTGLGLYVAREIARAAGGELTCVGRAKRGATFFLELPVAQMPAATQAA